MAAIKGPSIHSDRHHFASAHLPINNNNNYKMRQFLLFALYSVLVSLAVGQDITRLDLRRLEIPQESVRRAGQPEVTKEATEEHTVKVDVSNIFDIKS